MFIAAPKCPQSKGCIRRLCQKNLFPGEDLLRLKKEREEKGRKTCSGIIRGYQCFDSCSQGALGGLAQRALIYNAC